MTTNTRRRAFAILAGFLAVMAGICAGMAIGWDAPVMFLSAGLAVAGAALSVAGLARG